MKRQMQRSEHSGGMACGQARRGQTLVEFALVALIVFLPVVFGTIEIGRGVWYHHQLSQLSREGARWVMVSSSKTGESPTQPGNAPGSYLVASCSCPGTAVDWISRMDVGIPREDLTVQIVRPGLPTNGTYYHGIPVTVRVTYPYQPVVTSLLNIPATLTLRAETTMQMQ